MIVDHHFREPSTEWKEHRAVAVSFAQFFQILHTRHLVSSVECRPGLLSGIPDNPVWCDIRVHAGDGFQFWNIIDFHTLPCVNAKFYKFRNDSFDFSHRNALIKEYAQFVAAVSNFLDLVLIRSTSHPGRKTCSGYPDHHGTSEHPVCNIR